jgi:hypothetical protein
MSLLLPHELSGLGAVMIDLASVLEAGVVDKGSVLQNNSFHT